jgi:uncharacterized protein Yka (UPF0111/DUF47 family)
MVLARFLPRDEQFFAHFRDAAENAAETARLLAEVVENGNETERKVRRLRDLEHHGDEISHRIFSSLNSTFVTPLDREEIRALATALDNFVGDLEETGKRLWHAPVAVKCLLICTWHVGWLARREPHWRRQRVA